MVIPFLNYQGKCAQAIALYERVFAVTDKKVARFADMPPDPKNPLPEHMKDYVLNATMEIGGTRVWMGDTTEPMDAGEMITLAVPLKTPEEVERAFGLLLEDGGEVLIPLAPQFYSKLHGCVRDKFGVGWQVLCEPEG